MAGIDIDAKFVDNNRLVVALDRVADSLVGDSSQLMQIVTRHGLFLQREMSIDIEVDTGRTKNAIFGSQERDSNRVAYFIGNNVAYSPFVRDAGHGKNFMENVRDRFGRDVLGRMAQEIETAIIIKELG